MKKKLNLSLLIALLVFLNFQELRAQSASSRVIGSPSIPSSSGDIQICARTSFNSFTVTADLSSGNAFDSGNQFLLEVSDENGSFDDPTNVQELASTSVPNSTTTSTEILFENFSVPENFNSDTYRLRVRSTSPEVIGSITSAPVAIHFLRDDIDITLDNRRVIFCDVTSFSKTVSVVIKETLSGNTVDPNDFEWEWLKNGIVIPGENASSITITEEGTYFARIPGQGKCQPFFNATGVGESTKVRASIINTSDVTIETPASDFSFCPNESKILNSSETDTRYDYQWIKNGEPIEGETSPSITLPDNDFGGEYTLSIVFSEDCTLLTDPIAVINEGSSITQTLPENLILLPTQVIDLQIMTDAPEGSNVRWFVETTPQTSSPLVGNTSTFAAQFIGKYRVEISATDPCNSMLFSETELFAPTGIEMSIGSKNENTCDVDTFTVELLEMIGETVSGLKIALTPEQYAFFDFEWFKDGVPVGNNTTSLDISRSEEDSVYELRANLKTGEFTNITSNSLTVAFIPNDIVIQANPAGLTLGGIVTLSVPQNNAYTYQWFRNVDSEETLLDGETNNTLEVSENGEYFVRISSLICTLTVPVITIGELRGKSEIIPNIVTPNSDGINDNWLLPPNLFNQQDVEITIYNSRGQVDFTSGNYQNNWPVENSKSLGKDPIYYYIITKNNSVVRKGSITVMR